MDERAEQHKNEGIVLAELGRLLEAIASFDEAVAINPDDEYTWNYRGFALYDLGRYAEAVSSFDKALAINPQEADTWHDRGIALQNLGTCI